MLFYEELKQKRETLGLSVEQISGRTKISKEIINAIEAGDFKILPKTYTRLFLKAYAHELDIDPQPVLKAFENLIEDIEPETPTAQQTTPTEIIHDIPENKGEHISTTKRNRNFATVVIILVIIIFMISILKQVMVDQKQKSITTAFPDVPAADTVLAVAASSTDSQTVVPQTDLKLMILTKDSCWIRIIVDNRDSFEANLPPHFKKEAIAKEQFDVRVGRPTSVNLILNGKDLGPVGAPAIPTRVIITKNGIIRRQSFTTR